MVKALKILFISIGSILLLLAILIVLAGSGILNSYILKIAQNQANKSINGELDIGSLEGRLFSGINLHDVTLIFENDTLLYVNSLKVNYNIADLLRKEINTDISVINPYLLIEELEDSTWNFSKLIKPSGEEEDTTSNENTWKININEFRVKRLSATISTLTKDDMIPDNVLADFKLSGTMAGDSITVRLDSFYVDLQNPDIIISEFNGSFMKKGEILEWDDLFLNLYETKLYSEGMYSPKDNGRVNMQIDLTPFNPDDLKGFLPELAGFPESDISIIAEGDEHKYDFSIGVLKDDQKINISGNIENYKTGPQYSANVELIEIDVSQWTGDKEMKTLIEGKLDISGKGFDLKTNSISLNGIFKDLVYAGYSLPNTSIDINKKDDTVSGNVLTHITDGRIYLGFDLNEIYNNIYYNIYISYNDINLSTLTGSDLPESDLNGNIQLTGTGTKPESIDARIRMSSYASALQNAVLDSFNVNASISNGDYIFAIERMGTPYFRLNADGSGNLKRLNNVNFSMVPLNIDTLLSLFDLPLVDVSGEINGSISGPFDSLKVQTDINLSSISMDSVFVGSVEAQAEVFIADSVYSGNTGLSATDIRYGEMSIKSADITASLNDNRAEADILVNVDDSLSVITAFIVSAFENPVIDLRRLLVSFRSMEWSIPHDSATIYLKEKDIEIRDFAFQSGDQSLQVDGVVSFEGAEDLTLELQEIDLGSLPLRDFISFNLAGTVNSSIHVSGDAESPVVDFAMDAREILVDRYRIDSINARSSYKEEMLQFNGNMSSSDIGTLNVGAEIPMRLSVIDTNRIYKEEQSLKLSLNLDTLDLEKILALAPVEGVAVTGIANAEINITNSIRSPLITGEMNIVDGDLEYEQFGIDLNNIELSASIDSSTVAVDNLSATGGKGSLNVTGFLSLLDAENPELNDIGLSIKAEEFQAAESPAIELTLNSDIMLSGTLGKPGFSGNLTIIQSKANVDHLTDAFGERKTDPNPPLLEIAMGDTIIAEVPDTSVTSSSAINTSDIYRNLSGKLVIDIPRNMWITGKDMNFELEGSLQAIKENENLSLFGDLNIRRGYYKLYGKSFDFNRGRISFTGASEMNPNLDFEIVYRFRDIEKQLQDLVLNVSGRLKKPEYRFTLNDETLEEKDAISYLIFGKSINQLGAGERDKISGEELAMGAAMNQLSGVVKDLLQETAGVDVFEVAGGEDWSSGNVTIGKYVTNNLFLSYERSFDFDKQTKAADTEKIMLEYQIFRNFILKATNQEINSGFDFIFRKTWK